MAGMNGYYNPNPNYFSSNRYSPLQTYFDPQYVTGIAGANAYQMPSGVTKMILWDTERDCFYVKALDEMGIPRVIAWKDFSDHVESEPASTQSETQTSIDMSVYPTKKDLEDMLDKLDMTKYLTKDDFEKILGRLHIGDGGRIVRSELDS